jgi:hypothetical protein
VEEIKMKLERFKSEILPKSSSIQADKRLNEEDLRQYARMGQKVVLEELNKAVEKFNSIEPELSNEKRNLKLWGNETGDIHVDIVETEEEVEITVFEIKRRWTIEKEEEF